MKITNGALLTAGDELVKVLKMPLPVSVSQKVVRLAAKLRPFLEELTEVKDGLLNRFGDTNETGGISINPKSQKWQQFIEEWEPLMGDEVEIDHEIITLPLVVDGKLLSIEPMTLLALEEFVTVEEK